MVTAGQLGGGAAAGILGELSSKYMEQSFYNMGDASDASNASNSLRMNNSNYQGPGLGTYASGYQESMRSIKNLKTGLNLMSKGLDLAGYADGTINIYKGNYASGAHSIGNNALGIEIGTKLGWGYGLLYSATYTLFENTLPKSELYNRAVFGTNSPTYKSRRHNWTESKLIP
ncbi:hypothetical protein [Flavobacterium sp. JP2137]|uniref:hypothetical protein n=1 Tax=Flavobacterium sp. JP2137 TaxID=3414510 RepID=UPI003D2FD498